MARPGLEESLMLTHEWFRSNSFNYREFGTARQLGRIKRDRELSVSLILPTRNVAETIGSVLDEVDYMRRPDIRLIDQVIVVDADSADGTADIARYHDVEVYAENALMPEYGMAHGKGDAGVALAVRHAVLRHQRVLGVDLHVVIPGDVRGPVRRVRVHHDHLVDQPDVGTSHVVDLVEHRADRLGDVTGGQDKRY